MKLIVRAATAVVAACCVLGSTTALAGPASASARARHFQNCTAMHRVYPHGVGRVHAHDHTSGRPVATFKRSNRLYAANDSMDRDHDHIACEQA
jgi:hypothetical protein